MLAFIHITEASVQDLNAMNVILYENDAFHNFDRGYVDYVMLNKITNPFLNFIVKAKSNLKFDRMYSNKENESDGFNMVK